MVCQLWYGGTVLEHTPDALNHIQYDSPPLENTHTHAQVTTNEKKWSNWLVDCENL